MNLHIEQVVQPIGERIRALLKNSAFSSQKAFADYLGIDPTHLSRQLRGRRRFQPEQLQRVAEGFEIDLADLIAGTDVKDLVSATAEVAKTNDALITRLAQAELDMVMLRDDLKARDEELAVSKAELDDTRKQLQQFKEQSTRALHLAEEQNCKLQNQLKVLNRKANQRQATLTSTQGLLKQANEKVHKNFQAYSYWKKEAEGRGAALKVGGFALAGVGLVKLLSGASSYDDDDDFDEG